MKYCAVRTLGDGYHNGLEEELTADEFFERVALAFDEYHFIATTLEKDNTIWIQFSDELPFHEENSEGTAFFMQEY